MAKYIYPAVFTPDDTGFSIEFPDIEGCFTCGKTLAEGLEMAQDALSLMLVHYEDEKRTIPKSSSINDIKMAADQFATLICADTLIYRKTLKNMAVKKTLSIPQWLNESAMAAGVNFSKVLQDGLKRELDIYN